MVTQNYERINTTDYAYKIVKMVNFVMFSIPQ